MSDAFLEWAVRDISWFGMPFHFWTLVSFIFGAVVGSFLNVVIYRMPLGLSIIYPGSKCPGCDYAIPLRLNIPLISWLWLLGRCRNCRVRISPRYFFVELFTAGAFAGARHRKKRAVQKLSCEVVSPRMIGAAKAFEFGVVQD